MENSSAKYSLNSTDLKKIGVGAGVAAGGALLTYLTQVIGQVDFGAYGPIVMALFSVLVNIARKWITDHTDSEA